MAPNPGRIIRAALAALLLTSASGCAPAKIPKIGVSMATMNEVVYSFMQQEMVERQGADKVQLIWTSAENSESQEKVNVEKLINQNVDVIILHAVNTETAGDLVKEADEAGIPVVAMDRLPVASYVRLYVTADNRRAGRMQAEYLAKSLGGKGNLVLLAGDAGNSVAKDITQGNLDALARYPGLKVLLNRPHEGWSRDLAQATMRDAYARYHGDIQGVLANNSGLAMGALDAAATLRLPRPAAAVGADADRDACEAVADGRLLADIDKMPTSLGRAAYEAALRLARHQPVAVDGTLNNAGVTVEVKLTPVKLITRDNVRQEMEYRWGRL
jgi:ribose transport system substrate-binding protein/D-xylose transport system substrate-binding protein